MKLEDLEREAQELDTRIQTLERDIKPMQETLARLRSERAAYNVLISSKKNGSNGAGPAGAATKVAPFSGSAARDAYAVPILETLVEMGGKGDTDTVLNKMKDKMEVRGLLGQDDYKDVPGGSEVRWRNTGRWTRNDLVRRGLLSSNSARGVWEITQEGRAWLLKHKRI